MSEHGCISAHPHELGPEEPLSVGSNSSTGGQQQAGKAALSINYHLAKKAKTKTKTKSLKRLIDLGIKIECQEIHAIQKN